jgi:WXG100 family type VII secretion target
MYNQKWIPESLDPLAKELTTASNEWKNLHGRLNTVINAMNAGIIGETQQAFQGVHSFKQQDYQILTNLLDELPKTILTSLQWMEGVDNANAQSIHSRYGI